MDKAKAEMKQPVPAAHTLTPAKQESKDTLRDRQTREGSVSSRLDEAQPPPRIMRKLPQPVLGVKVHKAPIMRRFNSESAQHLGDRLSALETRLRQNDKAVKSIAKAQVKAANSLHDLREAVDTQQTMMTDLTRNLALLSNLKNEMLDAMQQMFAQQNIKKVCDERPGPPKHAFQTRLEGPSQDACIQTDASITVKGRTQALQ